MKVRDLEWWIVGLLGLIAFVLAFSGFTLLFTETETYRSVPDLVYQSIKIFGMDFPDEYLSPLPWQLETARWLAPALVIYTAIKALLYLIRREIKSAFVKYKRNHIIIVGLNDWSRQLVSDLIDHREKVVVVGEIADVRKLDPVERKGAVLVEGDLSAKSFLRYIGAARAKYFVFISENDERNIENALIVHSYLEKRECCRSQTLYTHVSDEFRLDEISGLRLLEDQQAQQSAGKNFEVRIFSAYERASRIIFNKYSPDIFTRVASPEDPPVRIAIIGSGNLAQSFILRIARLAHYANLRKTHVTLFQDGKAILERMELSFRRIRDFIDIELVDAAPDLFDCDKFGRLNGENQFSVVYILCDTDAVVPGILNKLSRIDSTERIHVVVAVNNHDSLLGKRVAGRQFENIELHKFNVSGEAFTSEGLISETIDRLAKVVHDDYLSKLKTIDPARASHKPWDLLPQDFKNQNREQADHILVKLRVLGYDFRISSSTVVIPDEHVELLSQMEHNRWWAFMALNGWVNGGKRDDRKRRHTDLKPFAELPEETKQYDRNAVLNIPVLIEKYIRSNK